MPRYDRQCNACEFVHEVVCKISEKDDPRSCPECGSEEGQWLISASAIASRSERLMTHKKDGGFQNVLQKIAERNPRTAINERV